MSTNPKDRLLEYALGRVYRDEQDVDHSREIIEAWERGVSGTGLAGMDLDAAPVASVVSPRPMLWLALAASLLVGLLLIVTSERPTSAPFVRSTVSMQVADGARFEARGDAPAGAWISLPASEVQLSAASGHELFVSGPALVRLEPTEAGQLTLDVLLGDVRVQQPAGGALLCSTGFGTLASDAESSLRCSVQLTDGGDSQDPLASGEPVALVASMRARSRYAHVEVQSGSCRADFHERSITLESGSQEWFASEPSSPVLARLAKQREFEELLEMYTAADWEKLQLKKKNRQLPPYAQESSAITNLLTLMEAEPSRWQQVELATRAAFKADGARPWQREGLVYLLLRSSAPQALDLLRELWIDGAAFFGVDAIVALAERGLPEFGAAVDAIVAAGERAPQDLVLASAYVALRGSDAGLFHLLAFVDPPSLAGRDLPYTLLAAIALYELGETEFLTFAHRSIQLEVEDYIELGELERAASFLAPALFFEDWRLSAAGRRLGYLVSDVNLDAQARLAELAQVDALRTGLRRLVTD